jgi:hypothetical protein
MRGSVLPRTMALTLTAALSLAASARILRADDAPPAEKAPAAEAPAAETQPASDAAIAKLPEPELIEEVKLIKLDAEGKTVTILIPPDPAKSGRAYKRMKFVLDANSLIMVDQQPSTMAALQEGMIINISHLKKGKTDTVDTIVVVKAAEQK